MRAILITIITSFFMLLAAKAYTQTTINLLDGQQVIAQKIYDDSSSIFLKYDILKKDKIKQKSVDKLEIFSINYSGSPEMIIYRKDSALGYPLTIGEMRNYVTGERDARKNYKAPWVTVGGVALGGVSAAYIGFWALTGAVVYGTGMGIIGPKVKSSDNISQEVRSDKNFINGYKDHATRKKVKNAILGVAIGVAVFGVSSAIYNYVD